MNGPIKCWRCNVMAVNGLAGAGTLVRYGDDSNDCNTVRLQFDAGRGTTMRLSQLGVSPGQVTAIFFTHVHSDHADGFADLAQLRWNFNSNGPKLDVVCADDMRSALGFTLSCRNLVAHIGDAYLKSGEIAQRRSEDKSRLPGGPAAGCRWGLTPGIARHSHARFDR
jgi:ribonuclease Z